MNGDRYTIDTFPFDALRSWEQEPRRRGNQGTRKTLDYLHNLTAFDIETTRDPETDQAWMYIWMWGFEGIGVLLGRSWDELRDAMGRVREVIGSKTRVIVVHNLSFEFQFPAISTNGSRRKYSRSGLERCAGAIWGIASNFAVRTCTVT